MCDMHAAHSTSAGAPAWLLLTPHPPPPPASRTSATPLPSLPACRHHQAQLAGGLRGLLDKECAASEDLAGHTAHTAEPLPRAPGSSHLLPLSAPVLHDLGGGWPCTSPAARHLHHVSGPMGLKRCFKALLPVWLDVHLPLGCPLQLHALPPSGHACQACCSAWTVAAALPSRCRHTGLLFH